MHHQHKIYSEYPHVATPHNESFDYWSIPGVTHTIIHHRHPAARDTTITNTTTTTSSITRPIENGETSIAPDESKDTRTEFTRLWVQHYLSNTGEERRDQLREILCDPSRGDDNVIMRLSLDYEIEANFTVLALLLSYFNSADPAAAAALSASTNSGSLSGSDLLFTRGSLVAAVGETELTRYKVHRLIARDPKQSGFTEMILNSLKQFGYSSCNAVFNTYDLPRTLLGLPVEPSVTESPFGPTRTYDGNVLTLILQALEAGRFHQPDAEFADPDEKNHIQWIEDVIRAMLEQPTLTQEMKIKFVNNYGQPNPWLRELSCLSTTMIHENFYLGISRLLVANGADVSHQPLMLAIKKENIELVLEMLLAVPDLMSVNLNAGDPKFSLLDYVRNPLQDSFAQLRYSTPLKLAKRIIIRLHQWQEEQRKQLELDPTSPPNDATIRDWLRQQLSTLPNQLWSPRLHYYISILERQVNKDECRRDYIRRWIHQLQTAPHTIHLFEMSGHDHCSSFLNDSSELFLQQEFRSHIPLLLTLFDESHLPLVDVPLLLGSQPSGMRLGFNSIAPFWNKLVDQLLPGQIPLQPDEQVAQQGVLAQLFRVTIKRFNQMDEMAQDVNKLKEYLSGLSVHSKYSDLDDFPLRANGNDHASLDLTQLQQALSMATNRIAPRMSKILCLIGTFRGIEVFHDFWLNILSELKFFRQHEFQCKCELMESLVLSVNNTVNLKVTKAQPLKRIQTFLTDPLLRTSDLFLPFDMLDPTNTRQGFTLRQVIKNELKGTGTPHKQPLLDWVVRLESSFWPSIRRDLDDHLIPDLSNIILTFLQPNSHAPTHKSEKADAEANADTTSASSTPAFSFQFAPSFSKSSFRPLAESTNATPATVSPPLPFTFSFASLNATKSSTSTTTKTTFTPIAAPLPIITTTTTITSPFTNNTSFDSTFAAKLKLDSTTTNPSAMISTPGGSAVSTAMIGTTTTSTPSTAAPSPFNFSFLSQPTQTNNITNTSTTIATSSTPTSVSPPTSTPAAGQPFAFSFAALNQAKVAPTIQI